MVSVASVLVQAAVSYAWLRVEFRRRLGGFARTPPVAADATRAA